MGKLVIEINPAKYKTTFLTNLLANFRVKDYNEWMQTIKKT